jgi:hypothetical protein
MASVNVQLGVPDGHFMKQNFSANQEQPYYFTESGILTYGE